MPIVFPNSELQFALQEILSSAESLHLFQNNYDVLPGTFTLADFTEATFSGYTEQALVGSNWNFSGSTTAVADYNSGLTFQADSSDQDQQIYGYYITRDGGSELLYAETFPNGPYHIDMVGDSVTVIPRVTATNVVE